MKIARELKIKDAIINKLKLVGKVQGERIARRKQVGENPVEIVEDIGHSVEEKHQKLYSTEMGDQDHQLFKVVPVINQDGDINQS